MSRIRMLLVPSISPRLGGLAGLLIPVPVAAVATITLTVGENLRQYGMPWLLSATALLLLTCVGGVHSRQAADGRRLERAGYTLSSVALWIVAAVFAVLGVEDLVDTTFGTGRFLSSNGAISAAGTLTGSVASLVVLPAGLVLFGIGTVRAGRLPGLSRWLPLAIPLLVVVGAAVASKVATQAASLGWISCLGLCCAWLGTALLSPSR